MSGRLIALLAVFAAVVGVGVGLVVVASEVDPAPSVTVPSVPASTVTERHPDTPSATTEPVEEPRAVRTVTAGAFCDPEGALGVTSRGTAVRCTRKPGEDRPRWRSGG